MSFARCETKIGARNGVLIEYYEDETEDYRVTFKAGKWFKNEYQTELTHTARTSP